MVTKAMGQNYVEIYYTYVKNNGQTRYKQNAALCSEQERG